MACGNSVSRCVFAGSLALGMTLQVMAQSTAEFSTELSADEVGPTTADPDGSGSAQLTAYLEKGQLCYVLSVEDIAPAYAAHLHLGEIGRIGPVQVELGAPAKGSATGCVTADRNLMRALIENPSAYYVDVHNAEYPGAALRGQLGSTVTQ